MASINSKAKTPIPVCGRRVSPYAHQKPMRKGGGRVIRATVPFRVPGGGLLLGRFGAEPLNAIILTGDARDLRLDQDLRIGLPTAFLGQSLAAEKSWCQSSRPTNRIYPVGFLESSALHLLGKRVELQKHAFVVRLQDRRSDQGRRQFVLGYSFQRSVAVNSSWARMICIPRNLAGDGREGGVSGRNHFSSASVYSLV